MIAAARWYRVPVWRRAGFVAAVLAGLILCGPSFGLGPRLEYWQETDSMPRGLYVWWHSAPPVARGEVVVLRDPPHFHLDWLMKRAVGIAGDRYCWDAAIGTHRLNGQTMPPPVHDVPGLEPWRGCVTLAADQVVGYGISASSYDSRYLGPVELSRLWGVYLPVWVERVRSR
jgi:type IV secretory pathway protease TraF